MYQGKDKKWHIDFRDEDAELLVLRGDTYDGLEEALATVASLAALRHGVTVSAGLEACLLVESYVHFIHRGLLHITQTRRIVWQSGD